MTRKKTIRPSRRRVMREIEPDPSASPATIPQRKNRSLRKLGQSDLASLLANLPDEDTAPAVVRKLFDEAFAFFTARDHDRFLIARTWGGFFLKKKKSLPHGNSAQAKAGELTWSDWLQLATGWESTDTADKWIDLWVYITPDNPDIGYDSLGLTEAYDLIHYIKSRKRDPDGKSARARTGKGKGKGKDKRPRILTLGSAVRAAWRAADDLKKAAELYNEENVQESPLREAEGLRAFYQQCREIARLALEAGDHFAAVSKGVLASEHRDVQAEAKQLQELHGIFAMTFKKEVA